MPVEMVQFLWKLLLKPIIFGVCHDFHLLLVVAKLLTAKLHSRCVKKSVSVSEILEGLESNILPRTPQPWLSAIQPHTFSA